MFRQSPTFYLIVGAFWSAALAVNMLESGFSAACIIAGLGAVFFFTKGICLAVKCKRIREDYHEKNN